MITQKIIDKISGIYGKPFVETTIEGVDGVQSEDGVLFVQESDSKNLFLDAEKHLHAVRELQGGSGVIGIGESKIDRVLYDKLSRAFTIEKVLVDVSAPKPIVLLTKDCQITVAPYIKD